MKKTILLRTLLIAAGLSVPACAMEKPNNGQVIRKEVDGASVQSSEKKARANGELEKEICLNRIQQEIYNLNSDQISDLLVTDIGKSLNRSEKSNLLELAFKYYNQINELAQKGSELATKVSDAQVKLRFSHQEDLSTMKNICRLLNVYVHLKNLRFPQALFSPKPYVQGPRVSLDKALESLIMAEQAEIASCCFHFTLYNLAKALVEKKNEGISIQLVTNQKQSDHNPILTPLKHLTENGIPVLTPRNNTWETNHHKFFVFRKNIINKSLVWSGSYNPTGHSNENSWEDVTILDDGQIVKDYLDRFIEVKSASKPITIQELNSIQSNPSQWTLGQNNVPKELWK